LFKVRQLASIALHLVESPDWAISEYALSEYGSGSFTNSTSLIIYKRVESWKIRRLKTLPVNLFPMEYNINVAASVLKILVVLHILFIVH